MKGRRCGWHRMHLFVLAPDDGIDSDLPYEDQWFPSSCTRCGIGAESNLARGLVRMVAAAR